MVLSPPRGIAWGVSLRGWSRCGLRPQLSQIRMGSRSCRLVRVRFKTAAAPNQDGWPEPQGAAGPGLKPAASERAGKKIK